MEFDLATIAWAPSWPASPSTRRRLSGARSPIISHSVLDRSENSAD